MNLPQELSRACGIRRKILNAITICRLTRKFGDFNALQELSIDVAQCKSLTFLGPSGCGKTTLLKLISGFLDLTEGHIQIDGKDCASLGKPRYGDVLPVLRECTCWKSSCFTTCCAFGC
ncbi:ATP-binding cassette domain-containing protein [uncultured Roseobacter sp.]|uniref:ATP-binding cassette domain-containing protein n=1 Tax=uncultured Roseobacter sp. TaxID=114847 RepID=UPI00262CB29E|nr:ATP-binding cassette domain-containing protein [uncultured Roseobacter sp.]